MKIKIIAIGKINQAFIKDGIKEYSKRLSKYTKLEVIELNDSFLSDNPNDSEINNALDKEALNITKYLKSDDYIIVLDVKGKAIDNYEYVEMLEKAKLNGKSSFVFIIGSSHGLSESIKAKAHFKWSFSNLVFTHQMIRFILLEQIYRGFKIMNNEKYHK